VPHDFFHALLSPLVSRYAIICVSSPGDYNREAAVCQDNTQNPLDTLQKLCYNFNVLADTNIIKQWMK
jgi:hypothetical protein